VNTVLIYDLMFFHLLLRSEKKKRIVYEELDAFPQCFGSVTFRYGSGSSDPYL
jgi:hypothetical protein